MYLNLMYLLAWKLFWTSLFLLLMSTVLEALKEDLLYYLSNDIVVVKCVKSALSCFLSFVSGLIGFTGLVTCFVSFISLTAKFLHYLGCF